MLDPGTTSWPEAIPVVVVALMLVVALTIGKLMPRLRPVQLDLPVALGVQEARQKI